jgi:RimJ/RimL family protein N-acetyltransferase
MPLRVNLNKTSENITIVRGSEELIPSFYECLDYVARERNYLELLQAPPFEVVKKFQMQLIVTKGPLFYAVENNKVVGWCDIFPLEHVDHGHRSRLGMGLLPDYRGKGLGSKLLAKSLECAKDFAYEKVELRVYAKNHRAKALYLKHGFIEEGLIRKYRKVNNEYDDCYLMAKSF